MIRLTAAIGLLSLLLVCVTFAQSQPPTPRGGKREGRPPDDQSKAATQTAAPDQRGTTSTPLVIQLQETERDKEQSAKDEADRQDEASARWWSVGLTGALLLVTLITGGFVGWQAWETRNAADASVKSANAALAAVEFQRATNEQWLEGEWLAEVSGDGDDRAVTVAMTISNPRTTTISVIEAKNEVASRATAAKGFSQIDLLGGIVPSPVTLGPHDEFQVLFARLPWMTNDNDRGASASSNVTYESLGKTRVTRFVATITWVGGDVRVLSSIRNTRLQDTKDQGHNA